jgi:signal transduction histidine kinase/integral membrane sensor domain MASE1
VELDHFLQRFPARWRNFAIGFAIFAAYYALAKTGLMLATINKSVSPIWPATGLAIALLFRFGRRYWPAVALAAFLVNFQTHISVGAATAIATGNMLEGVVGAEIFRRASARAKALFGSEILVALPLSAVLATPISATVGSVALVAFGGIERTTFGSTWLTWWIGDTLGALIFAPLFIHFTRKEMRFRLPGIKMLALAVLTGALSALVFVISGTPVAVLFGFYPLLFLAAFCLSTGEAAGITLLIVGAAVVGTATGRGPFIVGSENDNLVCLALFLGSLAITEQGLRFVRETGTFRLSAVVLFSGWILGALILQGFIQNENMIDRSRFTQLVGGTMAAFEQREFLYEAALRGGSGIFAMGREVQREEWRLYVDSLGLNRNYPGLIAIGEMVAVPESQLAKFNRQESTANPDYHYHAIPGAPPSAPGAPHFIVRSIEPREKNSGIPGLDIATESRRYDAARRAADTGLPAITRPIQLLSDTNARPAFLLLLPMYRSNHLFGWIYATLAAEEFLGDANQTNGGEVAFQIFFGSDAPGVAPIFSDLPSPEIAGNQTPLRTERLLWGEPTVFHWYRTPLFRSRHDTTSAWVIFACAFFNILLCAFIAILVTLNRRANELAERQAGEIRAQQAKLEHSSRLATLGEMAGGIAHEINNPLAILAGRALLLTRITENGTMEPGAIRENVRKITETVERIAKIIRGLRSFSRNGARDPFRAVGISKIVSATLDFCAERFRNQKVDFRISDAPTGELVCREVQIVQVLLNLLNNAFDAVIPTADRWISIDVETTADHVLFSVSDSGSGIDPAVVENMMTPFFTTKPVGLGTGLGLSISSGIAEEHGGSLRYELANGHTRFVFAVSRKLK